LQIVALDEEDEAREAELKVLRGPEHSWLQRKGIVDVGRRIFEVCGFAA
jgi:hypothetical protein